MLKKFFSILFAILLIVGLSNNVFANDKYTTTSNINGITVNWEYELNETNQIKNLKCSNAADLTGKIILPSTLDGKQIISLANEAFILGTKITEVTIPSTVKEIGLYAFSGCKSLKNVDLGNVEKISDKAFNACTALTSIKLPKTLNKDASGSPFSGCTSLKNIVLEEGMTIVPNFVCAVTPIEEITIPSTVKEIGLYAFSGCKSLKNVDLGNVEKISDKAFNACTALTSIKLPKTLNKDASGSPFSGCTSLKNIVLEEGMTIVPNFVCAVTPIEEITIPSTVKEIGLYAFSGCTSLNKITILDSVKNIEGYSGWEDLVFKNHNENLTIYCYKDSMAANYAIKYNIKYVYLTKPITDSNTNKEEDENKQSTPSGTQNSNQTPENKNDTTIATGELPKAGINMAIIFLIISIAIISVVFYKKYNNYKDIK